jgi:hypothetical protein
MHNLENLNKTQRKTESNQCDDGKNVTIIEPMTIFHSISAHIHYPWKKKFQQDLQHAPPAKLHTRKGEWKILMFDNISMFSCILGFDSALLTM